MPKKPTHGGARPGAGRPRQGKQVKEFCGVRLEPRTKNKLVREFGTLQGAIDHLVEKWLRAQERAQERR